MRKCHVMKRLAQEELVVFGLTERDGDPVQVTDQALYNTWSRRSVTRSGRRLK